MYSKPATGKILLGKNLAVYLSYCAYSNLLFWSELPRNRALYFYFWLELQMVKANKFGILKTSSYFAPLQCCRS